MQSTDTKVPEQQLCVFAHAAEAIVAFVTAPWIKGHTCDIGLVPLAARYDLQVLERPNRDKIVLSACLFNVNIRVAEGKECPMYQKDSLRDTRHLIKGSYQDVFPIRTPADAAQSTKV